MVCGQVHDRATSDVRRVRDRAEDLARRAGVPFDLDLVRPDCGAVLALGCPTASPCAAPSLTVQLRTGSGPCAHQPAGRAFREWLPTSTASATRPHPHQYCRHGRVDGGPRRPDRAARRGVGQVLTSCRGWRCPAGCCWEAVVPLQPVRTVAALGAGASAGWARCYGRTARSRWRGSHSSGARRRVAGLSDPTGAHRRLAGAVPRRSVQPGRPRAVNGCC